MYSRFLLCVCLLVCGPLLTAAYAWELDARGRHIGYIKFSQAQQVLTQQLGCQWTGTSAPQDTHQHSFICVGGQWGSVSVLLDKAPGTVDELERVRFLWRNWQIAHPASRDFALATWFYDVIQNYFIPTSINSEVRQSFWEGYRNRVNHKLLTAQVDVVEYAGYQLHRLELVGTTESIEVQTARVPWQRPLRGAANRAPEPVPGVAARAQPGAPIQYQRPEPPAALALKLQQSQEMAARWPTQSLSPQAVILERAEATDIETSQSVSAPLKPEDLPIPPVYEDSLAARLREQGGQGILPPAPLPVLQQFLQHASIPATVPEIPRPTPFRPEGFRKGELTLEETSGGLIVPKRTLPTPTKPPMAYSAKLLQNAQGQQRLEGMSAGQRSTNKLLVQATPTVGASLKQTQPGGAIPDALLDPAYLQALQLTADTATAVQSGAPLTGSALSPLVPDGKSGTMVPDLPVVPVPPTVPVAPVDQAESLNNKKRGPTL